MPHYTCNECGAELPAQMARKKQASFCSTSCRQKFNARRRDRGRDMYDLFMALRYDRCEAKELEVWSKLCRMAEHYRDEDQRERAGRKSWRPAKTVLRDRPDLSARTMVKVY